MTVGHGYFTLGKHGTAMQVLNEVSQTLHHWIELNELHMPVPLLLGSLLLQIIGSGFYKLCGQKLAYCHNSNNSRSCNVGI